MQWMIFYSEHALDSFFWDGVYPIGIGKEHTPWSEFGEITEQEIDFFNSIAGSRKKIFEIKGRGRFIIHQRGVLNPT